ncbi:RING finger protein 175 [Smittium mucronatum]|uniref:RING finger protein 175 n=1 Tax=Smittium mucronatum TaxID=133383 RepID=A0A1R0H738_9FUNG|nr:RING finger protein 175 [Smittium mucronatum]
MGQDLVDICIDRISVSLGYYSIAGLPSKVLPDDMCAICGCSFGQVSQPHSDSGGLLETKSDSKSLKYPTINDSIHTLNCGHKFHNGCIRGWCLIGKRDICPYCHEKVDLKHLMMNHWDKQQKIYLSVLDFFRYVIAWQPVTLLIATSLISLLGLV